jgi:hypothetical protein
MEVGLSKRAMLVSPDSRTSVVLPCPVDRAYLSKKEREEGKETLV